MMWHLTLDVLLELKWILCLASYHFGLLCIFFFEVCILLCISRLRGAHNAYNRGGRGASNRYAGRNGSSHFSSTGIHFDLLDT